MKVTDIKTFAKEKGWLNSVCKFKHGIPGNP